MKKTLLMSLVLTLLTTLSFTTQAKPLKFGTGGETGNYYGIGNDIKTYCEPELADTTLDVQVSGGSIENLQGLTKKKYSLVIAQEDVLRYLSKKSPDLFNRNRVKIIHDLYIETAHFWMPNGYKPKGKGGLLGFFNKPGVAQSIYDLKGQTIGAWGGSLVSLQALDSFLRLGLNIVEIPPAQRKSPKIPFLMVGGQPYPPAEAIAKSGRYTLLNIDFRELKREAPFYVEQEITYGKVSGRSFGVKALVVGKAFRNEKRNLPMSQLSKCITLNLPDLADDPDTNANWQRVEEDSQIDWSYFSID